MAYYVIVQDGDTKPVLVGPIETNYEVRDYKRLVKQLNPGAYIDVWPEGRIMTPIESLVGDPPTLELSL